MWIVNYNVQSSNQDLGVLAPKFLIGNTKEISNYIKKQIGRKENSPFNRSGLYLK